MALDWIFGMLTRPGDTFNRAQTQMRFGYWWILLSIVTLETVIAYFTLPFDQRPHAADVTLFTLVYLLILFAIQAVFLLASARVFHWAITWREAVKFTGLTWAVLLAEDIVTFYPTLADNDRLALWLAAPFVLWYLAVVAIGVRRVSGLSTGKAILLGLMAALPWRGGLYALGWYLLGR